MGERIRSVQITEVEQLQLIAKRTFFTTFRESYSDEDFKQFFSYAYDIDVLRKELEQSNSFHYFYEVDQNIVGFLKLNINVMHIWKYNAFTLMKHFKGVEEDNYLSI